MSKAFLYPLRRLHGQLYERKQEKKRIENICKRIKRSSRETALYILTPTHGNLGDHAIAKACILLFRRFQIPFLEIPMSDLRLMKKYHKLKKMKGKVILVQGGGFLGTLWFPAESLLRDVIENNYGSHIVCLPNTIYYENSDWGHMELEKSIQIYNSHPGLKLYAREKISYDAMKSIYRDVELNPDMVLLLNECKDRTERHGCLICLRKDVEKTRSEDEEREIYKQARKLFGDDIIISDMVADHNIPLERRNIELNAKFDEFRHATLVITDRLHGMIFAAITGTPCIVINSKSPKVKGCYEWIKRLEYIKFAETVDEIKELYQQIPKREFKYDNSCLQNYYEKLGDYISDLVKKG